MEKWPLNRLSPMCTKWGKLGLACYYEPVFHFYFDIFCQSVAPFFLLGDDVDCIFEPR